MIIIADSGSTKTTWCFVNPKNEPTRIVKTQGINPFYQSQKEILSLLRAELQAPTEKVSAIFFYGAGCANEKVNAHITGALSDFFGTSQITVESDLLAAARSLCQRSEGIACILGTGSNSCYYDGEKICTKIFTPGFILGDNGSGSQMGKRLLTGILKKQLPQNIVDCFFETYKTTPSEIMENIYQKPFPNRYAARFAQFIFHHISEKSLHDIVSDEFSLFFREYVLPYPSASELPVHFTGSVAWHFRHILAQTAKSFNLEISKIAENPMEGLLRYHETW
ncbi:MAG: ATPase [Prolixibacteraceae bacterium]|nr:ATPase [Prolixibacteraceae bacterium]